MRREGNNNGSCLPAAGNHSFPPPGLRRRGERCRPYALWAPARRALAPRRIHAGEGAARNSAASSKRNNHGPTPRTASRKRCDGGSRARRFARKVREEHAGRLYTPAGDAAGSGSTGVAAAAPRVRTTESIHWSLPLLARGAAAERADGRGGPSFPREKIIEAAEPRAGGRAAPGPVRRTIAPRKGRRRTKQDDERGVCDGGATGD
jgi:hypothetical protein